MPPRFPEDVREEVHRMREALRAAVLASPLSSAQVEEELHMCAGSLSVIFEGKVELRVTHVFAILRVIGIHPWGFFLELLPRSAHEKRPAETTAA